MELKLQENYLESAKEIGDSDAKLPVLILVILRNPSELEKYLRLCPGC